MLRSSKNRIFANISIVESFGTVFLGTLLPYVPYKETVFLTLTYTVLFWSKVLVDIFGKKSNFWEKNKIFGERIKFSVKNLTHGLKSNFW